MSFVGIALLEDGLAGFADSKSLRYTMFGNLLDDPERASVKKIFLREDGILCAFGDLIVRGSEKSALYTEDWLAENISEAFPDLCLHLQEDLGENYDKPNKKIEFLFGGSDVLGLFVQHVEITKKKVVFHPKSRERKTYFGGSRFYQEVFERCEIKLDTLEQYSKTIPELMEYLIEKVDEKFPGKTVGGKINMEVYRR